MHWVVHLKDGPKKYDHAAVAVGHRVFSFGGYASEDPDQIGVHVFNTVSLRWAELPPVTTNCFGGRRPADVPSMRRGHTAVLIDDTIYIWGGILSSEIEEAGGGNVIGTNPDPVTTRGGKCNVLYAFDVAAHRWSKPRVSGAVPEARCLHSACAAGKAMYVFGGYQQTVIRCTSDVYKWDAATALWSLVHSRGGSPAPASSCHSATVIGTKMFVFGGGDVNKVYCNAVSVFDTETRCWLSTPPPPSPSSPSSPQLLPERRGEHSAFAYNRQLYIFGGRNVALDQAINDLWRFCPRTFSWEKVEPRGKGPTGSWVYMMCCCMVVGDRVVLFGRYRGRCMPEVDAEEGGFGDEDEVEATDDLYILDLSPSLKTLCKLAVVQCGLERSGLPSDIRWELSAMSTKSNVLSIHFKCKEL